MRTGLFAKSGPWNQTELYIYYTLHYADWVEEEMEDQPPGMRDTFVDRIVPPGGWPPGSDEARSVIAYVGSVVNEEPWQPGRHKKVLHTKDVGYVKKPKRTGSCMDCGVKTAGRGPRCLSCANKENYRLKGDAAFGGRGARKMQA